VTLKVESLQVAYGAIRAISSASLTVEEGEAVALIGSNGAGKSTLLRAISGMLAPVEGSVHYLGEPITGRPVHTIARLGIAHVPEGRRLFPRMTVEENLVLGAFGRRDTRVKADMDHQLDLFPRLRERLDQEAGTLSGGEQQMVALARALMSRPRLLLLDEPSLGLSPLMATTVFRAIADIHREGTSLLLVEQNAAQAFGVTSRGYVMAAGEIVRGGSTEQLRVDPMVRDIYLGATIQ
jgi:branched-chain amino acid transport system ATP-binding protein